MHVVTRKGAGYEPAVRNPEKFHGIAPFDIATGEVKKKPCSAPSYTSVFGRALVEEARRDERIVAITAAMKDGTGLSPFAEEFPDRFVDAGIAEEHAVGMASGLAIGGRKPVVAIYSTFLQRAIDQMAINNALADLDVVFAIDRAGVVGEDGPTHHGMYDLVYTRMVPNMRVLAPSDEAELVHALHTALALGGPFAIRYPRGAAEGVPLPGAAARAGGGQGPRHARRRRCGYSRVRADGAPGARRGGACTPNAASRRVSWTCGGPSLSMLTRLRVLRRRSYSSRSKAASSKAAWAKACSGRAGASGTFSPRVDARHSRPLRSPRQVG